MSTFIFIDRRATARGRSSGNRQRLLDRIKDSIRNSKPADIDAGNTVTGGGTSGRALNNPIRIARDALHEPTFHYDPAEGDRDYVLVGNDVWERGDRLPVDEDADGKGSGDGSAGQGEDGEDEFVVSVSRDEFYNIFFEDCELPDLRETAERELPEAVMKPAGFQKEGNAAQLSVIRSYRHSMGRRAALLGNAKRDLELLEEELKAVEETLAANPLNGVAEARRKVIVEEIELLTRRMSALPLFEKVDLRYRKTERVEVKSADAVLFMLMDVSGSMDEDKKTIARKLFALQYAFIKRKYPNIDLVFIIHTNTAEEQTEEEFFTTRRSGGTTVSSALALARQIINERYDPEQTNIYMSYASDGDNWDADNPEVIAELVERGTLAKLRHMVYAQVGHSFASSYTYAGSAVTLWSTMRSVAKDSPKLHCIKIDTSEAVFDAFKQIYAKNLPKKAES